MNLTTIRFAAAQQRTALLWMGLCGATAICSPAAAVVSQESVLPASPQVPATDLVSLPVRQPVSSLIVGDRGIQRLGAFDIVINPGPALASNAPALAAFNRAALQWESFIADPILVTIDADLAPLGAGILGGASAVLLFDEYSVVRNVMVDDAAGEVDDAIVGFLPSDLAFAAFVPTGFELSGNLSLAKANAKALNFDNRFGDLDAQFGASDAEILFSSTFQFDFDNSNGVAPGTYDFETVAAHEIGHALGFLSEVDYIDAVLELGEVALDVAPTTVDLFRFERGIGAVPVPNLNPATATDFTNTPRWLVPGADAIFDQIDASFGGDSEIRMATGVAFGNGQQASHWQDNLALGIMDPSLATQEISPIRHNDLRALDLIGYEIRIPEPATLSLLCWFACCCAAKAGPSSLAVAHS